MVVVSFVMVVFFWGVYYTMNHLLLFSVISRKSKKWSFRIRIDTERITAALASLTKSPGHLQPHNAQRNLSSDQNPVFCCGFLFYHPVIRGLFSSHYKDPLSINQCFFTTEQWAKTIPWVSGLVRFMNYAQIDSDLSCPTHGGRSANLSAQDHSFWTLLFVLVHSASVLGWSFHDL